MSFGDIMQNMAQKLSDNLKVGMVFGEPKEAHGKTVIPVSSFGFGFGLGGDFESKGDGEAGDQSGGGGGGGGAEALGVFEISELGVRFTPVIRFRDIMIVIAVLGAHYWWYRIVKLVFGKKK